MFSTNLYSVFHQFGWAKFAYGGSTLSSSQFGPPAQLPKNRDALHKKVTNDSKIIISKYKSKSFKHTVVKPVLRTQMASNWGLTLTF
jgi:hypothetical protein